MAARSEPQVKRSLGRVGGRIGLSHARAGRRTAGLPALARHRPRGAGSPVPLSAHMLERSYVGGFAGNACLRWSVQKLFGCESERTTSLKMGGGSRKLHSSKEMHGAACMRFN